LENLFENLPGVNPKLKRRAIMYEFGMNLYTKCFKTLCEIHRPISMPAWTTANSIKLELENIILRDFSVGKDEDAILIISPQAGHHSCIADFGRGQSLVEATLKAGKKSVYATEWKSATLERKSETIDDFILSMRECIRSINSKVTLIGLCQGGWQSAIYTALFPEDVSCLVLAAAPIDFHAGNSKIGQFTSLFPFSFYRSMVIMGGGLLDGKFLLTGFKMLNPVERYCGDYFDLFFNISDQAFLKRNRKFRDWYEYTQCIPGEFFLQVVKELFKNNKLIKGKLTILGRKVDLANIYHPLILIAGEKDDITPTEQLFNIEHYVKSEIINKYILPAGHIGIFMGKKMIDNYWPKIFEEIFKVIN
jgi:poly(3-hydroxybutyrate) depolymerase